MIIGVVVRRIESWSINTEICKQFNAYLMKIRDSAVPELIDAGQNK